MNWCILSSYSTGNLDVRQLSIRNHVDYAAKHNLDFFMLVKPWEVAKESIAELQWLLHKFDAVFAIGADVIITNPSIAPDTFHDSNYGLICSSEDIGGACLNNDVAVYPSGKGIDYCQFLKDHTGRALNHKWLWQGVTEELMKENSEFGQLVKLLPAGTIQSLPPWEYQDRSGCWKPGDFCCHFLMENKAERMKRFLSEHPEFA